MGAMASKKASWSSPVSVAMACARPGEVKRPGRHDDLVPVVRRQPVDRLAPDLDQRLRRDGPGHRRREAVAVDGQRAAGRHLMRGRRRP